MAKNGVKSGGRDFQPGESGNPNGRPPIPEEIKKARLLNKVHVEELLNKFLNWPLQDLVTFSQKKESPVLELLVARILLEAIKKGDQVRLEFLFQRLIGKVKEEFDHNHKGLSFHAQIVGMIEKIEHTGGKNGDNKAIDQKENEEDQNKKD